MADYEVRRMPGEQDLTDAFAVRRAVFVDEQGVSQAEEWDGKDEGAIHFLVYADGTPVGTARLRMPEAGVAKAERVAVCEQYRGEGIGRLLMERLEAEARTQGCSLVRLHAQTAVEGFYETLGYEPTSDVFVEADIPHVKMEKPLD